MTDNRGVLASLDGKSSTLFLLAGALLAVFAANTGARVFTDGGYPPIHNVFAPAGFFVGMVGLFALYPRLADRSTMAARVAGVVAAIPLVGWFVHVVFGIGNTVGVLPDVSVVLPGVATIVVFLTTMLAYLAFSVTSLRGGVPSRRVGFALLLPVVPFLALIVAVGAIPTVEWGEFAIDSGHALAQLTLGVTLRARGDTTDHGEPAADATP